MLIIFISVLMLIIFSSPTSKLLMISCYPSRYTKVDHILVSNHRVDDDQLLPQSQYWCWSYFYLQPQSWWWSNVTSVAVLTLIIFCFQMLSSPVVILVTVLMLIIVVPSHHADIIQFTLSAIMLMIGLSFNPHNIFSRLLCKKLYSPSKSHFPFAIHLSAFCRRKIQITYVPSFGCLLQVHNQS